MAILAFTVHGGCAKHASFASGDRESGIPMTRWLGGQIGWLTAIFSEKVTPSMGSSSNGTTKPLVGATVVAVAGALAWYALHLRRELDLLRRHKNEQLSDSVGKKNTCVTGNSSASKRERPTNRSEPALIHPIGTIRSPFPQRAGTPRQGLLAPHARSLLILEDDMPFDVVDGLKEYSHVWVVFVSKWHTARAGAHRIMAW